MVHEIYLEFGRKLKNEIKNRGLHLKNEVDCLNLFLSHPVYMNLPSKEAL